MNRDTLQATEQHQQIALLLPWYLNQSLELAERRRVEDHIRGCILCRRELVHLGKLAEAVKQASDLDVAAEASFSALRAKLQTPMPPTGTPAAPRIDAGLERPDDRTVRMQSVPKRRNSLRAFCAAKGPRLAIAASLMLAIIPVAMQYGRSPTKSDYYTLSDIKPEASSEPRLRVVFSKSLSDADIDAVLAQIHGQRVDGPNSVGAYTVRLENDTAADSVDLALAFLRSRQDVMLAEPVLQP